MFSTFERIKTLAKSRGYSISKLEENLGLSKNAIYAIKRNQPSAERLQEIANYFNVSTDYLLGRTDNPRIATDNKSSDPVEAQLIAAFRNQTQNMTEDDKMRFNKALEGLMATAKTIIDDDSKWG
ncbi:helix-turn-helix domain-containing protein [Streptococcus pluranimalium]|uniref:HTH cro/C1-type domain-containing protein n=1 Tax=Streptococcus pluranimalium TaxID=82348 RepID=A0A345VIF5_9STRE|nr:helix-turn-helix transcriptional regulator [Streptococcus pluranimalium]AXJ12467.1 hypothetical protein Sp14A_05370 [Streptococcus pluranimalium]AXJ12507.1 hypothetical protein Sp14A_05770 [Streptococcus pluranimalium]